MTTYQQFQAHCWHYHLSFLQKMISLLLILSPSAPESLRDLLHSLASGTKAPWKAPWRPRSVSRSDLCLVMRISLGRDINDDSQPMTSSENSLYFVWTKSCEYSDNLPAFTVYWNVFCTRQPLSP